MAWIESHQNLKEHPKTISLCEHLGAERPQVVGHLHLLWWWCIDYAPDGDISKFTETQISRAAEWAGDPHVFADGLIKSGFVERVNEKAFIHDWHQYCGALMERRLKRLEAKRPPMAAERPPTLPYPTNHTQPTLPTKKNKSVRFEKPTADQITEYAKTIDFQLDGQKFWNYYESKGWGVGRSPMKNWKAAVMTWKKNGYSNGGNNGHKGIDGKLHAEIGGVERPDSKYAGIVKTIRTGR